VMPAHQAGREAGWANPHGTRNADMTTPRPAEVPAHSAMFTALAVPNFRRYASGQSLSLIGGS
jgi:hypothetical protein